MSKASVIVWDWNENIDIEELRAAILPFGATVYEIEDTGGDSYAIVICPVSINQNEAISIYKIMMGIEED